MTQDVFRFLFVGTDTRGVKYLSIVFAHIEVPTVVHANLDHQFIIQQFEALLLLILEKFSVHFAAKHVRASHVSPFNIQAHLLQNEFHLLAPTQAAESFDGQVLQRISSLVHFAFSI